MLSHPRSLLVLHQCEFAKKMERCQNSRRRSHVILWCAREERLGRRITCAPDVFIYGNAALLFANQMDT